MSFPTYCLFALFKMLMLVPAFVLLLPITPCPSVFNYERVKPAGDIIFPGKDNINWKGVVHVPRELVLPGEAFQLTVVLTIPAALPTKYVGRVEFNGNREQLLDGSLDIIKYDVRFPSHAPIPSVLQVRINERVLCYGFPYRGPVVTKLILEHSLFPVRFNISARRFEDSHREKKSDEDLHLTCGDKSSTNPLIVAGRATDEGQWPWLVPIFHSSPNGRGLQFLCAGTLISEQYVISAGHCFEEVSDVTDLVVHVGRRNIRNWTDSSYQPRGVQSLVVHPDFDRGSLFSDLALLKLSAPISRSLSAHPVCLWSGPNALHHVVGKKATVVGWGTDDAEKTKITAEPKAVEMPIVSQESCLRSSREFFYYSSNRTLCAGARDGTGPCNGDSGGGLYLPLKDIEGRWSWFLRGIVSLSLLHPETRRCNLDQYLVFTDVAQFWPWIQKNILL